MASCRPLDDRPSQAAILRHLLACLAAAEFVRDHVNESLTESCDMLRTVVESREIIGGIWELMAKDGRAR